MSAEMMISLPVYIFDPKRPYAIPYERFSSGKQARGSSLFRQRGEGTDTNEFIAASILKMPLNETLTDSGLSAYSGEHLERGALGSLIKKARDKLIPEGSVIIIDEWTRLCRLPSDEAHGLLSDLIRAGIGVFIKKTKSLFNRKVLRGRDGPMQLMNVLMHLHFAHEESKSRGRHVRIASNRRVHQARESGRAKSANGPSWLNVTAGREAEQRDYTPNDDALWVVRRIFHDLRLKSFGAIARELNDEWRAGDTRCTPWGIARQRSQGSVGWFAATISEIAYKRAVLGEYQPTTLMPSDPDDPDSPLVRRPNGPLMPDYYTWVDPVTGERRAAITQNEWDAAHAAIAARRNAAHDETGRRVGHGGRRGEGFPNLLLSLTQCGECGGAMIFRRSKASPSRPREYTYLQCRSHRLGTGCTNRVHCNYLEIERQIGRIVATDWLFASGSVGQTGPSPAEEEIARQDRRLEIIARAISDWMVEPNAALKEMGRDDTARLAEEKMAILRARPALIKERDEQRGTAALSHREAVQKLWLTATAIGDGKERVEARMEVNTALRALVDAVIFDADGDYMLSVGGGALMVMLKAGGGIDAILLNREDGTTQIDEGGRPSAPFPTPVIYQAWVQRMQERYPDRRALFNARRGF